MDSLKKKSVAMIDSNSGSDSDLSDSEFKNLAKKPKLDTDQVSLFQASKSDYLTVFTDHVSLSLTEKIIFLKQFFFWIRR